MKAKNDPRLLTGVRNLDALLTGGLPKGSSVVFAGPPGSGKTILTQQICFHNAGPDQQVLYFNTLSEPTAKALRYLTGLSFFDARKVDNGLQFVDLGAILRTKGVEEAAEAIMSNVRKVKPSIVVIDSFKVFDELTPSTRDLRKFGYDLAINLMAWESTTFLLGEYGAEDIATNPLFSIVDGLIRVTQRLQAGEQQRFLQIVKMRGTDHSRDEHPFVITGNGIEVFAPRVAIQREGRSPSGPRLETGISKLDELIQDGIPRGSSLLVAGPAGTGKTVLLLEFIYRGAQAGEKGILFSFEETRERLLASAAGLGWDLEHEIQRGMIEIVFIPQPAIMVEAHLLMIRERMEAMQARRVGIDSVSVFLHKVADPQLAREKMFQLATVVQNQQAVGLFATDVPYGSNQMSRFGVEETVVDGVILLTSREEGTSRQRYLEVYKLRNTGHLKGRHDMVIGRGGIQIYPRYDIEQMRLPPPAIGEARLGTGVPGLDALLGGGVLEQSATLVSGSAGIGKSTLGLQFLLEGRLHGEPGLFVTLEEGPGQIRRTAEALELPLKEALDQGTLEIIYLSREHVRANQIRTILVDLIRAKGIRRLVLDSVSHMAADTPPEELRQLLYELIMRFKTLGVTSVLTLESASLFSTDTVTERGFSPITDNLIMLRYAQVPSGLEPRLTIVKTRGSAHEFGTYPLRIGRGGLSIQTRGRKPSAGGAKKRRRPPARKA